MIWPFNRSFLKRLAEIEAPNASGAASVLARRKTHLERALKAEKTDELRRDLAAGKRSIIADRAQVVACVMRGNGVRRQREESLG